MADLKTKPTEQSVEAYVSRISDAKTRQDAFVVLDLMRQVTKSEPKMWGESMIGFGSYHYKYKSGHEGDWFVTGFSPRKQSLTLYLMGGLDKFSQLLKKLGKIKARKSCLYIKRLEDINLPILEELIQASVKQIIKMSK